MKAWYEALAFLVSHSQTTLFLVLGRGKKGLVTPHRNSVGWPETGEC